FNRAFGFQTANQFVVVDDADDVSLVDRRRQLGRVVGVDDKDLLAFFDIGQQGGGVKTPALQNEGGFGVGDAQHARFGSSGGVVGHHPSPDDGRAGGVGVRGFVAEN